MKIDCRNARFALANPRAWIILCILIQCRAPACQSYLLNAESANTPSQRVVATASSAPPPVVTNTAGQRTKSSALSPTILLPFRAPCPQTSTSLAPSSLINRHKTNKTKKKKNLLLQKNYFYFLKKEILFINFLHQKQKEKKVSLVLDF